MDVTRERAEQQWLLRRAERSIDSATLAAIGGWLDAFRLALLQELGVPQALVAAAGDMDPASAHIDYSIEAAVARSWGEWQNQLENQVLPTVSIAFGEAFQQTRRADPQGAFRHQQQYLAEVSDRLKIWPQGAFEDIRPELLEALSEAETVDQMTDRIGRVLTIDAKSRELRAQINEVEERLASPDLDPADRAELRAWRKDLWEQHDESLNEWQWKARRIARTESHGAVSAGQLAAAKIRQELTGIRMWKRWLSTSDSRTRASHRVADGQTCPLDEPFRVGGFLLQHPADSISVAPHEVINCFVADTRVHAPGVQGSMRSRYTGRMITVRMASGGVLTGTPNHPVLTERGWVGLGELNEGDQMVYARVGDRVGAWVDPEVERIPATIGEVHDSFMESADGGRVLGGPVNFHGDVSDGEVEVVRADRELRNRIDATHREHVGDDVLEGRHTVCHFLPGDRAAGEFVIGAGHSAYGVVGGAGELGTIIGAGLTHAGVHGCGSVAGRDPVFKQHPADDVATDAVLCGEALLRRAAEVTVDQARSVEHVAALLGYARVANDAVNVARGDAEVFGDVLRGLTGGVSLDRVVAVDVTESWSGHVFTLQSESAMFLAEGYIARNCRCTCLIYDDDELQDEFEMQGGKGPVEPGSVRIGPDDADTADAAIAEVAEAEKRPLPKLGQRGEDAGQSMPADPVDVEITDERTPVPAPDVETATDDRLADYLIRTDEREDDELRALVEEELARRRDSDEIEVQFGEPEHADDVIEVDDDGDWLDDPRWAADDEDLPPVTDDDEPQWDDWQVDDDDLPGDVVPADPPEIVENIGSQDLDDVQAEFERVLDEFAEACDSGDDDRINDALAKMDAAEARLNEATQAAEVDLDDDDDHDLEPDDDGLEDSADSYDPDDPESVPPGYETIAEIFGVKAAREDYERDQASRPEMTAADRRRYELMDQADAKAEAEGIEYEQALAELQGLDLDQLRRREFVANAKLQGLSSTNFADLLDELHRRLSFDWLLMAEDATRGHMLSRRTQAVGGFDESMLWRVNDQTARRHMSPEMAEWFDEHGRITKADLERMIEAGLDVFDAEGALGEWARWSGRRFGEDYLR